MAYQVDAPVPPGERPAERAAVSDAEVEAGARAILAAEGASIITTDEAWPREVERHRRAIAEDGELYLRGERSLRADAFRHARLAVEAAAASRPAPPPADAALRAEVERLRAELAVPAPPNLLRPEWGMAQFERLFGQTYHPVRWGKHHATHDATITQALRIAGQRAPELADVIAALIWTAGIVGNRVREAFSAVDRANERAEAAERALGEARGVLQRVEWAGGGTDRMRCPCCHVAYLRRHAPGCALAAQLAPRPGAGEAATDGNQSDGGRDG